MRGSSRAPCCKAPMTTLIPPACSPDAPQSPVWAAFRRAVLRNTIVEERAPRTAIIGGRAIGRCWIRKGMLGSSVGERDAPRGAQRLFP